MARIYRREFLSAAGGMTATAALSRNTCAAAKPRRRFNILFLMMDQHIHNVMGCAGNQVVQTPNLDALAAGGARFTHATCVTPFCSPTRASLLTGRYPHAHGITANVKNDKTEVADPYACTESMLFDQGWVTAHLGKWHLGRQRDLRCYAGAETFSESKTRHEKEFLQPLGEEAMTAGPRPGEVAFNEYFLTEEMAAYRQSKKGKRSKGSKASAMGRERVRPECCYESWLADQCIALLERNKDRNFMITYSVSPPHAPWICPDPYYDMYDPGKMPLPASTTHRPAAYQDESSAIWGHEMGEANLREYLRCYYGQVTMMDAFMGRILDALKRLGLEEDTLVVYTSDHGDMQAAHNMAGKSVGAFYDELLRVPLVIRYPRGIEAGSVFGCSASSVDVMPTLLDYAGIEVPATVQGKSLRPYIERKVSDRFDAAYCGRGSGDRGNFGRMVRTLQAKYTYFGNGRRELFDLETDPHEMKDVAQDPQSRPLLDKMHGMLLAHSERTEDPALGKMKKDT